jgi:hypothetical protein
MCPARWALGRALQDSLRGEEGPRVRGALLQADGKQIVSQIPISVEPVVSFYTETLGTTMTR